MAYQSARDRYVSDGAGVVPQPRLLIMLYDRLVLDLEQADTAIGTSQLGVVNDKLCHAQSILLELHAALDIKVWPAGEKLAQLYIWFNDELVQANISKDAKKVRVCLRMVKELQAAWHRAYEQVLAEQGSATATSAAAIAAAAKA